jgi:hypothetical protein
MDRETFLNLRHLPFRVDYVEAGYLVNATEEQIAIGVSKKLFKPLGKPSQNARKWLALVDVQQVARDRASLDRLTNAIASYHRKRNSAHQHSVHPPSP